MNGKVTVKIIYNMFKFKTNYSNYWDVQKVPHLVGSPVWYLHSDLTLYVSSNDIYFLSSKNTENHRL